MRENDDDFRALLERVQAGETEAAPKRVPVKRKTTTARKPATKKAAPKKTASAPADEEEE